MAVDTIIRVIDVQAATEGCKVVYAVEDTETLCLWEGTPPKTGDVFVIDTQNPGKGARKLGEAAEGSWTAGNDALRWRKPVTPGGVSRMEILRRRHIIRRAVRGFLDQQGFMEIDAPLLVRGASPDLAVGAFGVGDRYLVSSTEYQLKRMAIGGFTRLYSLTQNFRKGDSNGRYRNPEFTMLEWGRVGGDMRQIEDDVEIMVAQALDQLGLSSTITYQGQEINLARPWEKLSVLAAIERFTGIAVNDFDVASCRKAAEAAGMEIREDWANNRDFLFSLLMDHIQPQLGREHPVFLTEWPMFQTTSATADATDPTLANRSELFIAGIELSDGFAGLADVDLQTQFINHALSLRVSAGQEVVALDEKYLAAMRLGAPYGAGMALGFDRLVMLLTDQSHIDNVLAFGWDEL